MSIRLVLSTGRSHWRKVHRLPQNDAKDFGGLEMGEIIYLDSCGRRAKASDFLYVNQGTLLRS
jgi:hypothetical protein